jgi:hypothetical protein
MPLFSSSAVLTVSSGWLGPTPDLVLSDFSVNKADISEVGNLKDRQKGHLVFVLLHVALLLPIKGEEDRG